MGAEGPQERLLGEMVRLGPARDQASRQAEAAAAAGGVEAMALDRYALARRDVDGLLLGFAAFDPSQIRAGVLRLAAALAAARDGGAPQRRVAPGTPGLGG
jgi:DNA-binding transcriptional MocR family regulator